MFNETFEGQTFSDQEAERKVKIKKIIKSRILSEYRKYHNMTMDDKDAWAEIASCKIVSEIFEQNLMTKL
jgi:hypothetical protein